MNPKKSPSLPSHQGGGSAQNTSTKVSVLDMRWAWKNHLIDARLKNFFFFLYISLITPFFSYSQTIKESPSIFILQGTVKLKGKPVEGVSLELLKNEKQITKIITRKNGMYSFQMDKSNIDIGTEYILNIKKEGVIPGILRINTYTSKEELNYVPYVFNLEINLILPTASGVVKRDFGKIKWAPERGVFDFDKEYVSIVEKDADSVKVDSSNYPLAVIDKINKRAEEIKITANEQAKQKTDDLKTQELVNENSAKVSTMKGSTKTDDFKTRELVNENLAEVSTLKESEKAEVNINANEKRDTFSDKKKLAPGNKKSQQSEAQTEVLNQRSPTSNLNTAATVLKKKTNEMAALKTNEDASKLSKLKVSNINPENKKEISSSNVKLETNNKQLAIDNQLKSVNTSSVDVNPTTFDGVSLFSTNNQKNKLLEDKNKMERKKTENLAKKYETSNILTSLLDVVEEFEEK
ncbi:MAG: hypothetical protein Q8L90_14960 [Bacteroidota bacterium]|nr:hypothetical protein [Bacteroidota bacterium]